MNADKLAQALRAFPEDPNPFTYRRAYAKAQAALAEHDAQPAQAAQPVGVPAGWMIEELDGGFVHVESPQTLAVNLGYYPEGNATASQLLRLLACALLAPQPPAQPRSAAKHVCVWSEDSENGAWDTGCGNLFLLSAGNSPDGAGATTTTRKGLARPSPGSQCRPTPKVN